MAVVPGASRPLWEVVGGGDKGGILVRKGQDTVSESYGERLSTGSVVFERELVGERLHYEILAGYGPQSGWVSLQVQGKGLLARTDKVWEVVGGGANGGILVRQGADTLSPALPDRLSTGAIVVEQAWEGERLSYRRLSGIGPSSGWVSYQAGGKVLLVKPGSAAPPPALRPAPTPAPTPTPAAAVSAPSAPGRPPATAYSVPPPPQVEAFTTALPERPTGPVSGRKMRVLAVHATPSNSNVMKFQAGSLRQALGKDAEWFYADAPTFWESRPTEWPQDEKRSEFEERLANKKPFVQWYFTARHGQNGDSDEWLYVQECAMHLLGFIAKQAPVDVIVSFSQGSSMVALLMEVLRREGISEPPWRLSVQFNGGNIDDDRYNFQAQSQQPVVYVGGGDADPFGAFILGKVRAMYSNLVVLEHQDGHAFPFSQPRSGEVYEQVAAHMRRYCGMAEKAPVPAGAPKAKAKAAANAELSHPSDPDLPPGMWTIDYIGNARGACRSCRCPHYVWNPSKLRPERGDDGEATITEWFLNDYSALNCQVCKCAFSDHRNLGMVNKPAGYHPGLNEEDLNALLA